MNFEYPHDIFFRCKECGLCCGNTQHKNRHILLLKSDAEIIAVYTGKKIEDFTEKTLNMSPYIFEMLKNSCNGKCVFLKRGKCIIYQVRPLICRFYPFELLSDSNGVYTFVASDECPAVSRTGKLGSTEKLNAAFFESLFRLASAKFQV